MKVKWLIGILITLLLMGGIIGLALLTSEGDRKENVGAPSEEQVTQYEAEVRGLVLKYILVDSAYEIYQVNVTNPEFKDAYTGDETSKAHYYWMLKTYEAMDNQMKKDLEMVMTKVHPWQVMNVTSVLRDTASLEQILYAVTTNQWLNYTKEEKERLKTFYSAYYQDYLEPYMKEQRLYFESEAMKLNKALEKKSTDIIGFMEQESGIPFKEKSKPVFYYTFRMIGAMGFEHPPIHASLIQRNVTDFKYLLNTPFHEFGHSLFDTFTSDKAFTTVAKEMKKKDSRFKETWENQYKDSYDWTGWCEENLVEGFARYLESRYYNRVITEATYSYDLDFYNYLQAIQFDPTQISLEEVSVDFYNQILQRKE